MNLAALTLMAAVTGVGQPPAADPAADVRFVNKRTLSVPVEWNPAKMQEVAKLRLFVSRDNGNTYELAQTITDKETEFKLDFKQDGVVWLQMQEQRRDGTLIPKDPSGVAPSVPKHIPAKWAAHLRLSGKARAASPFRGPRGRRRPPPAKGPKPAPRIAARRTNLPSGASWDRASPSSGRARSRGRTRRRRSTRRGAVRSPRAARAGRGATRSRRRTG